jgi:predicted acylesterase/phospholipase RssA
MTPPKKQRALVLGGGGSLGAYEVGVLKVLCKKLTEEDKEKGEADRLLFDIVAGTSIGAMNGAVLVSQYLQTKRWEDAVQKLEEFWIDTEKGLASTPPQQIIERFLGWIKWHEASNNNNIAAASSEAARRYYSAKYFFLNGAPKMYFSPYQQRYDFKFFDDGDDSFYNKWFIRSSKPLQDTIERFAAFPIATSFGQGQLKQPRFLVFSVDVAEGEIVTFDSYPKSDGCRNSEYGKYTRGKGYENVIKYDDGISIEHVMASGTIPEFYDYVPVAIQSTVQQKDQDANCIQEKSSKNKIHYFWDGGILSNTPFRELLQAHQDYWKNRVEENMSFIPDLEVYIINLHPSKMSIDMIPQHYDGIKDRHNDIKYGDRNSHYDQKMAHLVTDYIDLIQDLKCLAVNHFSNRDERDKFQKDFEDLLEGKSKRNTSEHIKYKDLIKGRFELSKVVRIERTNYINSIYGKTNDLTEKTIKKLIIEGKCDAWASLINEDINNLGLVSDTATTNSITSIKLSLIEKLNQIVYYLKENDFESVEFAFHLLTEFINKVEENKHVIDKLESGGSNKFKKSAESFKTSLQE